MNYPTVEEIHTGTAKSLGYQFPKLKVSTLEAVEALFLAEQGETASFCYSQGLSVEEASEFQAVYNLMSALAYELKQATPEELHTKFDAQARYLMDNVPDYFVTFWGRAFLSLFRVGIQPTKCKHWNEFQIKYQGLILQ